MNKSMLLSGALICALFFCCKTNKYTPIDYPDAQLVFGKGGGITGQVVQHTLFENGVLFKGQGLVGMTHEKCGKIAKNETTQLFKNYKTLGLSDIEFDHPGDRYYFIEWKKGGEKHRITWGHPNETVDKNVKLFYSLLNRQITTINEK